MSPEAVTALSIATCWLLAGLGCAAIHHLARRAQPPAPPLPRRPVDPDRHPAPIDDTYLHLEALYHLPARNRKENRP